MTQQCHKRSPSPFRDRDPCPFPPLPLGRCPRRLIPRFKDMGNNKLMAFETPCNVTISSVPFVHFLGLHQPPTTIRKEWAVTRDLYACFDERGGKQACKSKSLICMCRRVVPNLHIVTSYRRERLFACGECVRNQNDSMLVALCADHRSFKAQSFARSEHYGSLTSTNRSSAENVYQHRMTPARSSPVRWYNGCLDRDGWCSPVCAAGGG